MNVKNPTFFVGFLFFIDKVYKKQVFKRLLLYTLCISKLISEVSIPNLSNLLNMKNFKRIVLLIALVVLAGKVLFSDFEIVKSEHETAAIVNK